MLNESYNDATYWKNKLEELDSLPGETSNKAAAWGKLQERLSEKPPGKKAGWYWVAAACLLLAFLMTWLRIPSKETTLVKNNLAQKPKSVNSIKTPIFDSMLVISKPNHTPIKFPVINKVENKKQDASNKNAFENPAMTTTDLISAPLPLDSHPNIPDTVVVAVIPLKKKLRVVHINESGKPTEEPYQYVQTNAAPAYQTDPFMKNNFSRFATSKNTSDNILKIRLSPTN